MDATIPLPDSARRLIKMKRFDELVVVPSKGLGIGESKLEFISETIQTHNSSHNRSNLLLEIK